MDSDPQTAVSFLYLQAQSASAGAGIRTPLSDGNGVRLLLQGTSCQMSVEMGSQERIRINSIGEIGFGTTTPHAVLNIHSTSPVSAAARSSIIVSTGDGKSSRTFELSRASAVFTVPIYGDGSNLTGVNATSGLDTLLASTYSYTSVSTLSVSFSDSQNLLIVAVTSAVLPNVFGEFPTVAFRFNGDSGNNYSFATDVGVSSISLLTNAGSPPGTPPGTPYFKKEITITLKDNAIQGSKNFMVESIHSSDPLTYNRYFLNAGTYNSNNRITSIDMFVSWAKNGGKLGANADRPSYIEVYKMGGISTATNNGIDVYDEEVMTVRKSQAINFKGSGVSVAQNGSTATVTITGSGGGGDQSSFAGSIATGTINFNNNDLINGATAYFKTVYVSSGNLGSPSFAFVGSTMTGIYYDPSGGGTINFVKSSLDAPALMFFPEAIDRFDVS
jgi:hypothetical protein